MRTNSRDERGFFTIWVLGLCMCVFMLGGIGVDLWRGFAERRELAAMVDAAAIAAASQIDLVAFGQTPSVLQLDPAQARQRATEYMTTEADKAGFELIELEVGVTDEAVQVSATRELNLTLTKLLVPDEVIQVNAIGGAEARVAE